MFCKNCGAAVEEGHAFCAGCGAPVGAAQPPGPQASPAATQQPPAASSPRPGRRGLIAGIVAAIVIVLAGAGVGVYFGFFRDGGSTTVGTGPGGSTLTSIVSGSTTTTAGGAEGGETTITAGVGTTYQTIPSFPTTGTTGGGTSSGDTTGSATEYLAAQDAVVADLARDDERIPQLAIQINNSAPQVPKAVRAELQSMLDLLEKDEMTLASIQRPEGFEQASAHLQEAVTHMVNRIQATIQGVEAMWKTGQIDSSKPYFDTGRAERDAYRSALQKYYDVLPIE